MNNNENRYRQNRNQNQSNWFEIIDETQPVENDYTQNNHTQNAESGQYDQKFLDFFSPQNRVNPAIDDQNEKLYIDVNSPRERNRPTRNVRADRLQIDDDEFFIETDRPRRKRSSALQRNVPWLVILISVAAFMVILFAFIMEARANRVANADNRQPSASGIQAELETLGWIEQELLPVNDYSRPGTKLARVNGIVIHNIGNPGTTAMQNRNYFANLAESHERKASSNFIVCLDGGIIQCVPVDEVAFASNERNDDTLSIEVCHPDETGEFTNESYASTVRLTAWLCKQYGLTADDVIRHHDVRPNGCPRYFVDNEEAWEHFRAAVARAIAR